MSGALFICQSALPLCKFLERLRCLGVCLFEDPKMSAPPAGSLTDAALKRKERIERLKAAKRAKTDSDNNASGNTTELPK